MRTELEAAYERIEELTALLRRIREDRFDTVEQCLDAIDEALDHTLVLA